MIKSNNNQLDIYPDENAFNSTGWIEMRSTGTVIAGKLINFNTDTDSSNFGVTRMTIAQNGNVGIGTTNPSYELDVSGSIGLTGVLWMDGNNAINAYGNKLRLNEGQQFSSGTLIDGNTLIKGDLDVSGGNLTLKKTGVLDGTNGHTNLRSMVFNNSYVNAAGANSYFFKVATLPISTDDTKDFLELKVVGGGWVSEGGSPNLITLNCIFRNRGTFNYEYSREGDNNYKDVIRVGCGLIIVRQLMCDIFMASGFNTFKYDIDGFDCVVYNNPIAQTSFTGSLVFDSGDDAYLPNKKVAQGDTEITGDLTIQDGNLVIDHLAEADFNPYILLNSRRVSQVYDGKSSLFLTEQFQDRDNIQGAYIEYDGTGAGTLYIGTQNQHTENPSGTRVNAITIARNSSDVGIVGGLNVGDDTTITGDLVVNVAFIGERAGGDNYAVFCNQSLKTGNNDYAIRQGTDGNTIINSSLGQPLHFRIANDNKMVIASDGNVDITNSLSVGGKLICTNEDSIHIRGT